MTLFGKSKASEFDNVQDASLASHGKSITSIVKWCKEANKHFKVLYAETSQLSTTLKQLDKTLTAFVTEQNKQVSLNEDQEKRLIKLEGTTT